MAMNSSFIHTSSFPLSYPIPYVIAKDSNIFCLKRAAAKIYYLWSICNSLATNIDLYSGVASSPLLMSTYRTPIGASFSCHGPIFRLSHFHICPMIFRIRSIPPRELCVLLPGEGLQSHHPSIPLTLLLALHQWRETPLAAKCRSCPSPTCGV